MRLAFYLAILLVSTASLGDVSAADTLVLGVGQMRFEQQGDDWYRPSIFYREMCRQAVLIAARDELGLRTRDQVLREASPEQAVEVQLDLGNLQGKHIEYRLHQAGETLAEGVFTYSFAHNHSAMAIIADEAEKRSRGEFKEAILRTCKAVERPRLSQEQRTEKLKTAERRVKQMNAASQFIAVRLGHDLLWDDPSSPEALSILVQGYANLSVMGDFWLSNARVVFASRAIIYATRMRNANPESPLGYWHQAYAFTLFGLTKDSLWQLELADKISQDNQPPWMSLIRDANYFHFFKLGESLQETHAYRQLNAVLWFRSVECSDSQSLTIETAKRAIDLNPACLRVYDGMHRVAGVSYAHVTSQLPASVFGRVLKGGLPILADDSDLVAQAIAADLDQYRSPVERAKLAAALYQSSVNDTREPSVGTLAHILDETNVLYIATRVLFITGFLGVDASESIPVIKPIIENHPAAHLIEANCYRRSLTVQRRKALMQGGSPEIGFLTGHVLLLRALKSDWETQEGTIGDYRSRIHYEAPPTEVNYTEKMKMTDDATVVEYGKIMWDINPYSPQRGIVLLSKNWSSEKNYLQQWLDRAAEQPAIAGALAQKFLAEGDVKRAETYWRIYIDAAPDFEAYRGLAELLYNEGRTEEALELANKFLTKEDYGLAHAQMQRLIAGTYMNQEDFEKAIVYAEAAAESGAGWASQTLSYCYEALGKYDEAINILRDIDDHYHLDTVYRFAVRTRKLDLQEAWQAKREVHLKGRDPADPEVVIAIATNHLLTGNFAAATKQLETFDAHALTPFYYLYAATQSGQKSKQEAALAKVEQFQSTDEASMQLAELVTDAMSSEKVDVASFTTLIEQTELTDELRSAAHFLLGWCLERENKKEQAIEQFRDAANFSDTLPFVLLSFQHLNDLGAGPVPFPRQRGLQRE
jgi:tetratricopeptide (TPR) repeat protein